MQQEGLEVKWAVLEMRRNECQMTWKTPGTSLPQSKGEVMKIRTSERKEV